MYYSKYYLGDGVPEDLTKAFKWFQKAAVQGNAEAQSQLGLMYSDGEGVPKDDAKAFEWYQKAAVQGNAVAQLKLGGMYQYGWGVAKDEAKALAWWQKAAEQGNAKAQSQLGLMYSDGEGVPKDDAKAVEWWQKAAEQGNAAAQTNLGVMYHNGDGVPKDYAKAVEWWQKAAEQGLANAQSNLGNMFHNGEGIAKDDAKAVEWYQKAAVQGLANAQSQLGLMYVTGRGTPKNNALAYAWFNLAAAQGNAAAQSNRDRLETELTNAERTEGQRLAANWKEGDDLVGSGGSDANSASSNGKPRKQRTGTAFAVSYQGQAITNHHVIDGCAAIKVAGREGMATVMSSDSVNDLALLQLPGKAADDIASLHPDPGKLRQGEDVLVFGYPLNALLSSGGNFTPGILSAVTGLGNNTNQIQITAPIQPGSSGSPVMDKKGAVVAVVTMKLDDTAMAKATGQIAQNVNFAVNGQTVRAFLDANKVAYKTGGGLFSFEKSNADIADEARKWTVLVECWK